MSFLSGYVDALWVDGWYLACTEKTGEGRYDEVTRNETANWQLLDGDGNVLADGLRWWPKDDDWPIQPRPFEGFEDGADVAVIRIGQKYGLIHRDGRIVAGAKYDSIFGFLPGDATTPAELDGRWGAIDAAGNEVVPFIYDVSFARFEDGVTVAERDGKDYLLREDGTELLEADCGSIWLDAGASYGMARRGGSVLLFDRRGGVLFEKELGANGWIYTYADAEPPLAYNDSENRWGYLNLDGTVALGGDLEDASPFWKGSDTALVEVDGKWGMVRRDGSFAVAPEYDELTGFSEGLCAARRDGLWGLLDEAGNVAIPFQYDSVGGFLNGYADARPAGDEANSGENLRLTGSVERHGLIDLDGNWAIEPMDCWHIDVGADGVAVASGTGEGTRYFAPGAHGFEPVAAIDTDWYNMNGYLPNEDGGKLAALEQAPTLSGRLSDDRLPHLDGAYALYPVYAAFAQAVYPKDTTCYMGWNSYRNDGNPTLARTGVEAAWQRLSDGDADVIFVPAPDADDPIWAMLAGRGQRAEFTPLCREALVFAVNADNPVSNISMEQLEGVYAGKITDWKQLGAERLGGIVAYRGLDDGFGGTEAALEALCGFEDLAPAPLGVTGYNDWDGEAVVRDANYRNLPNALGCAMPSACAELVEAGEIRLLSVDGIAPTDDNIANGSYPWAQTYYAVRLSDNENPNVLALLEWIASAQGRELIQKAGFVPFEK
ncbi:MAG: WG repeat-containing protein [Clostridia bacterium]|nr:WG repeat-containing protein [Clostridia bacterium]